MNTLVWLASIGAWVLLLGGLATRFFWRGQQPVGLWLLSLSVILFYYSMVLRHLFSELDREFDWGLQPTRFDVSAAMIPAGLICCWFGNSRWIKGLGVTVIVAGFAIVFPGLLYPIEGVETGSSTEAVRLFCKSFGPVAGVKINPVGSTSLTGP